MKEPTQSLPPIEAVVPHGGDSRLLDCVLSVDGNRLEAMLTVRPHTSFSDPGGELPAWAMPEIMAQAVAAYAGCRSLQERGHAVPMGLLLGVRRLELHVPRFRPGEVVRVAVTCTSSDEQGRGVFDCELHTGSGLAATATLTAFQPPEQSVLQSLLAAG